MSRFAFLRAFEVPKEPSNFDGRTLSLSETKPLKLSFLPAEWRADALIEKLTSEKISALEKEFAANELLTTERATELADLVDEDEEVIEAWFAKQSVQRNGELNAGGGSMDPKSVFWTDRILIERMLMKGMLMEKSTKNQTNCMCIGQWTCRMISS